MNLIKSIIIDDEPPAVALIKNHIENLPHLEVIGQYHSAIKAYEVLSNTQVDLLFLDIRMPVLNGIDFLKTLSHPPAVILTTAYREYALDGYDLDIIDYLLKPITFERFTKAVNRYTDRINKPSAPTHSTEHAQQENYIYFNINKTHHKVNLQDIRYVESLKDYVSIYLSDERLVVKGNLGTIMKRLPEDKFLRIHRSYAIPLAKVKSFNQSQVTVFDIQLPIGVSYREKVIQILAPK